MSDLLLWRLPLPLRAFVWCCEWAEIGAALLWLGCIEVCGEIVTNFGRLCAGRRERLPVRRCAEATVCSFVVGRCGSNHR